MTIDNIHFFTKESMLRENYNLAYAKLIKYDSCIVHVKIAGTTYYGEVTPLIGYTEETLQSVEEQLAYFKDIILHMDVNSALTLLESKVTQYNAFALSSIIPLLEKSLETQSEYKVLKKDLVYGWSVHGKKKTTLEEELEEIKKLGYRTVKIKIGLDIVSDMLMLSILSSLKNLNIRIRFDANGGYSLDEAMVFLKEFPRKLLKETDYLEQPLCRKCWHDTQKLIARQTNIKIMIDESIYTKKDIERAKDIGAEFIKIKLCKFGSLNFLQDALDYACSLGLKVVFGNGVATDIANHYELDFFYKNKDKLYGASESVGFLKIQKPIQYELS